MKYIRVRVANLRVGDVLRRYNGTREVLDIVSDLHSIRDGQTLVYLNDDSASMHLEDTNWVFVRCEEER